MKQNISFALKLSKKSLALELLIAIQLSVVFALLVIMICAIEDRTVYYSIYEDAFSQDGAIIMPNVAGSNLVYMDDIYECFDKATNVTGEGCTLINYDEDPDKAYLLDIYTDRAPDTGGTLAVYSEEEFDEIPPYLIEGDLPKSDSEYLECLACDTFGYEVGEIVEASEYSTGNSVKIKICGILQDDQMMFNGGNGANYIYNGDFRDLYYYLNGGLRTSMYFLTSKENLESFGIEPQVNWFNHFVVNYEEGAYTSEELQNLSAEYGFTLISTTESYYEESNLYVRQEMYTLLPIAISILIITIFTAIITTVISTMKNLRNYAVLYLCGASWKNCGVINFINYVLISIVTLIIDTVFFIVGQETFLTDTVIRVNTEIVLICTTVLVVFLLLSLVVPLIVTSGKQPRDVLKTEFRN
ncbi:MAG: hypothetical protein LUE12_03395 [Ruminococcus sp.]|nr:hypothetical protein [Ruminococcus sp.]